MKFNYQIILSFLGLLLVLNGAFMLLSLPFSFYYEEQSWVGILISGLITITVGVVARLSTRKNKNKDIKKREGYLIVTLGWLCMALFGALPYVLSGSIPGFTNAFFETMSGYTTTGATIIIDIEAMPKGLLFWRSLTHWIGGMGIIVLTVAILPLLGIGGMQLFVAEAPGPTHDKLHPRITETAKRLWLIYVILTVAELVLLMLAGMNFFDAINHAMATMATGGFSTKNLSVAYYNDSPVIQYIIVFFMFLAGTNFTLTYFGFKGKFSKIINNEEFKTYLFLVLLLSVITSIVIFVNTDNSLEKAFRDGIFQVVSIVTTTGFVTADYTGWAEFTTILFFILFFTGASAGSTSGGIKIVRLLILVKNSILEIKRQIHPSAVIPVRFNKRAVSQSISYNISAFILIYIIIFFLGSLVMSLAGLDFNSSLGAVAATLGNIGPGIGSVGPVNNFAHISLFGQWFLSFLMLLGRLELFTVLILFSPYFWSKS